MAHRRANGEGTIYRRKDGRFEGAAYFLTTGGTRKRIRVYGNTHSEVHDRLTEAKMQAQRGIPVAEKAWRLGDYLDYWLEQVVRPTRRPKTYELYEATIRLNLKPGLGSRPLKRLSVPMVQTFLNRQLADGHSVRKVQVIRTVLSAALTRATREELVSRNVARLVELPAWERAEIRPWTADEATRFLGVAGKHQLYPAFLMLVLYGLRRGEVLGLRWCDVDFSRNEIRIRQQLQRIAGALRQGPVKTKSGRRELPLLSVVRDVLRAHQTAKTQAGDESELVFTSRTGQPVEPGSLVRSFQRICREHSIRLITVHHLRHTAATLLKKLGVPARDAQLILGHSQISITQEIYQHDDMDARRESLGRVESLLLNTQTDDRGTAHEPEGSQRCRQNWPSGQWMVDQITSAISGGPGETRTLDTLLKSSIEAGGSSRFQSVNLVLRGIRRQWMLGLVAVKCSRQAIYKPSGWRNITLPTRAGTDS